MSRYTNPVPQYLDNDGNPVPYGKLVFKDSGTADDKDTFADVNLTIANTNPVLLDGAGRAPNTFFAGTAKVFLLTSDDVQIWERDPVGGDSTTTSGGDFDGVTVYGFHDIVRGSDDLYYQSIINNNQGFDPVTVRTAWSQLVMAVVWNTNETYSEDDTARGSDGKRYRSLIDGNTANDPIANPTEWRTSVEAVAGVITADLVGDVTGDVAGDVTGSLFGNADTATKASSVDSYYRSATEVSAVITASEKDLMSFTLQANDMGSNRVLRVSGNLFTTISATFKFYLGSTSIDITPSNASSDFYTEIYVYNITSGTQIVTVKTSQVLVSTYTVFVNRDNTFTEDTTSDLTVKITGTLIGSGTVTQQTMLAELL